MLHYGIPFMTPMHMEIQLITFEYFPLETIGIGVKHIYIYIYYYKEPLEKSLKYLLTNGVSHGNM